MTNISYSRLKLAFHIVWTYLRKKENRTRHVLKTNKWAQRIFNVKIHISYVPRNFLVPTVHTQNQDNFGRARPEQDDSGLRIAARNRTGTDPFDRARAVLAQNGFTGTVLTQTVLTRTGLDRSSLFQQIFLVRGKVNRWDLALSHINRNNRAIIYTVKTNQTNQPITVLDMLK